jgi:hypothetical protein
MWRPECQARPGLQCLLGRSVYELSTHELLARWKADGNSLMVHYSEILGVLRPNKVGTALDETRASPSIFPGRVGVEGAANDEAHFPHSS